MKIGIEAERANLPNPTGVEHYAAELIKNLAQLDNRNEYTLYFRTKPQDWFFKLPDNFKIRLIPFPKFWTQIRISWEMIVRPVDVLLIPASALPFIHPKRSVVTVHDIAFELFNNIYSPLLNFYQKFFARFAARNAARLISVSKSTKNDVVRLYKTPAEKIEVIPLGIDKQYKPVSYEQTQSVLDKFGISYKKYILFLGTLQPRKNIIGLIDAFIKLKKENRIEEKLVIAGGKGWLYDPIIKKIEEAGIDGQVKFLGYVDEQDKPALYSGAILLTLPAFYEGFGLPPAEAMACGTPVVVSNISSLPEVVGDAGVLIDPNSVDSIAEGLLKVLIDKNLQQELSKKGIAQASKLTWEKTAEKTLALFESLK